MFHVIFSNLSTTMQFKGHLREMTDDYILFEYKKFRSYKILCRIIPCKQIHTLYGNVGDMEAEVTFDTALKPQNIEDSYNCSGDVQIKGPIVQIMDEHGDNNFLNLAFGAVDIIQEVVD